MDCEQEEQLSRVRSRIGKAVMDFCNDNPKFHADDLRKAVIAQCGVTAPGSADRILRDLRKRGFINYVVVNRRGSLYETCPVEQTSLAI